MSQKRRIEGFLDEVMEAYPGFEKLQWDLIYRKPTQHLVQSIHFEKLRLTPGAYRPLCGWRFMFEPEVLLNSWDRTFWLEELRGVKTGGDVYLPNRTKAEFETAKPEYWAMVRELMMPLLDRFDSLEKLVAAYDAETDFTPFFADEEPCRFNSWVGFNFGRSASWRRYNLGYAMAELGRYDEAIEHLEAMRSDYPAMAGVVWQEERDARVAVKIEEWRRKLSESGA